MSFERAELKLKLADLLGSLADAKVELVEVQDALIKKDKRIIELEEAFQSKDSFVRNNDAYYAVDANGNPSGVPFCLRCWESEHRKRQLIHVSTDWRTRVCTSCGHKYEGRLASDINPPANEAQPTAVPS